MSAILPRKFIEHQLKISLSSNRVAAQLVHLQHPWDPHGQILQTAATSGAHTQAPVHLASQQATSMSTRAVKQQHQQQQESPQAAHNPTVPTPASRHLRHLHPIPIVQASLVQLEKMKPPYVRQAEIDECRRMGQKLLGSLQGQQGVAVEVKVPRPLVDDPRLQALLGAMQRGGRVRLVQSVLKAKTLA